MTPQQILALLQLLANQQLQIEAQGQEISRLQTENEALRSRNEENRGTA